MIRSYFLSSLSTTAALSLAFLGACGDDSSGETENSDTTEEATDDTENPMTSEETTESDTATTEPGTSTERITTEEVSMTRDRRRGDDRVRQCLDQVKTGDLCGRCACMNCIDQLAICEKYPDCKAIRECAHEARCTGIDCLGPCGGVIKRHGGAFSHSGKLAHAVGICVDKRCMSSC